MKRVMKRWVLLKLKVERWWLNEKELVEWRGGVGEVIGRPRAAGGGGGDGGGGGHGEEMSGFCFVEGDVMVFGFLK